MYENVIPKLNQVKMVKLHDSIASIPGGFYRKYIGIPMIALIELESGLSRADTPVRLNTPYTLCLCPMEAHRLHEVSRVHPRAVDFVLNATERGMKTTHYTRIELASHQFPIRLARHYGREYAVTAIATNRLQSIPTPNSYNKIALDRL